MRPAGGYTKISNQVLADTRLSLGARVTYPAITHLAWKAGRREETDGVRLPALDQIAEVVGCSRTALKGYVKELRDVGVIVTVGSRSQGLTYYIYDTEAEGDALRLRAESALTLGQNPPQPARARVNGATAKTLKGVETTSLPPAVTKVDGHDLAFDALQQVCGIDPDSNRVRLIPAALHTKGATKGIRALFFIEAERWIDAHPDEQGAASRFVQLREGGEPFERLLAAAIHRKADRYRQAMPGAALTPTALRNHWLDLEYAAPPSARKGGLTADQVRARG